MPTSDTRHVRAILVVTLILAACGQPDVRAVPPSTPTATASASATGSPTSSPTASSSAFANAAAGTEWPAVVLYEAEGGVVRERTAAGAKDIGKPCGQVTRLAVHPMGLLAICPTSTSGTGDMRLVSLVDGRTSVLVSAMLTSWPADISADGRSAAVFRMATCEPPAPVCQTSAVFIDVATRAERELLPSGYHLGAKLGWTALGLTLFQPECAEAGCAGTGDKGGTFVWDGAAFKRWGDLRFVASAGSWTLLERLRSFADPSSPRSVVVRGPQGEVTLDAQAKDARGLAITDLGEAIVWRPDPNQLTQRGTLLRFAPDGSVRWQAELVGTVLETVDSNTLLVASPTNQVELYDLQRMLRFETSARWPVAVTSR
jgi:hypothetical protein